MSKITLDPHAMGVALEVCVGELDSLCFLAESGHGGGEDGTLIDPRDVRKIIRHLAKRLKAAAQAKEPSPCA
jgi:hypothetical protein